MQAIFFPPPSLPVVAVEPVSAGSTACRNDRNEGNRQAHALSGGSRPPGAPNRKGDVAGFALLLTGAGGLPEAWRAPRSGATYIPFRRGVRQGLRSPRRPSQGRRHPPNAVGPTAKRVRETPCRIRPVARDDFSGTVQKKLRPERLLSQATRPGEVVDISFFISSS